MTRVYILLGVVFMSIQLAAQDTQVAREDDFFTLRAKRNEMLRGIDAASDALSDVQTQVNLRRQEEGALASAIRVSSENPSDDNTRRVEYLQKNLEGRPTEAALAAQRQQHQRRLEETRVALSDLEDRLYRLLNVERAEQLHTLWISITFSLLVAFMVIGFYTVLWRDEGVRQRMFEGNGGMQLITLFCLVIAIILFGILHILEGKELAALLGGLSGYILGRVSGQTK